LKEGGFKIAFDSPTFNEFVVEFPNTFERTYKRLLDQKIVAGLPLATYYPELAKHYLMGVTETKTKEDIDTLVKGIGS
jgi:glycine dehydrogenase subunit 1